MPTSPLQIGGKHRVSIHPAGGQDKTSVRATPSACLICRRFLFLISPINGTGRSKVIVADELTHIDAAGRAQMVDVGGKPDSERTASARGAVYMKPETLALIRDGAIKKGDVLTVARIAGIMAAKRTAEIIPLCHPIPLTHIAVEIALDEDADAVRISATTRTTGKTGVEMEALTAVSAAALTVYDMAKAVDRSMRIGDIELVEKRGGVHGDYRKES
ncbi:MAG: cyclic pyranopterin monophosphate synthase MoaC [Anaerolineae bacterium]|nr:cyclic pyranopterin monophosphate synthase MoaC [Anaerolineae bacterium]